MSDQIKDAIEYGKKRFDNEHWDSKKSLEDYQSEEIWLVIQRENVKRKKQLCEFLCIEYKPELDFYDIGYIGWDKLGKPKINKVECEGG
jgi:hypothetical protein